MEGLLRQEEAHMRGGASECRASDCLCGDADQSPRVLE